jgi:carboxymethylenebutenolidase
VGDIDSTGSFELTAADGNVLAAYEAVPVGEARGKVVILPDIRGLHPYYRALAERFAEAGIHAVAVDYFGRTAGACLRDDAFDWQPHVPQVTPEQVRADVGAAIAHLAQGRGAIFTVGFCFGGGHSWRLAASNLGLAGAIGFYGRPSIALDVVDDVRAPVLMLVAGADRAIPVEDARDFAATLEKAGKDVELHVYEDAPHSFFDRSYGEHAEACADAWRRMLTFVAHHPAPSP